MHDQDLPFIVYNNRSLDGVVVNFMRSPRFRFNPHLLMLIDKQLETANSQVQDESTLLIDKRDLRLDFVDITYGPKDLASYSDVVNSAHFALLNNADRYSPERTWLKNRGITDDIISKYRLGSMSFLYENVDQRGLDVLGISCHPLLRDLLLDNMHGGGVLFPLYRGDRLVNCTVRRISDVGKLKYTQSCPELDVWGLRDIKPELPVWITEGIFDMYAINEQAGNQAVSVSSAMWSSMQLIQLLNLTDDIRIFADNDRVGLRSAWVLQQFFSIRGLDVPVYASTDCKDPAEHFLQNNLGWDKVVKIDIDSASISSAPDTVFNLTNYLKNRHF